MGEVARVEDVHRSAPGALPTHSALMPTEEPGPSADVEIRTQGASLLDLLAQLEAANEQVRIVAEAVERKDIAVAKQEIAAAQMRATMASESLQVRMQPDGAGKDTPCHADHPWHGRFDDTAHGPQPATMSTLAPRATRIDFDDNGVAKVKIVTAVEAEPTPTSLAGSEEQTVEDDLLGAALRIQRAVRRCSSLRASRVDAAVHARAETPEIQRPGIELHGRSAADLIREFATDIRKFATNEKKRGAMSKGSAIPTLCALLDGSHGTLETETEVIAVDALARFATDKGCCDLIRTVGGITHIVARLEGAPESKVVLHAANAIASIAASGAENRVAILQDDRSVGLLVALLSAKSSATDVAAFALCNLLGDEQSKESSLHQRDHVAAATILAAPALIAALSKRRRSSINYGIRSEIRKLETAAAASSATGLNELTSNTASGKRSARGGPTPRSGVLVSRTPPSARSATSRSSPLLKSSPQTEHGKKEPLRSARSSASAATSMALSKGISSNRGQHTPSVSESPRSAGRYFTALGASGMTPRFLTPRHATPRGTQRSSNQSTPRSSREYPEGIWPQLAWSQVRSARSPEPMGEAVEEPHAKPDGGEVIDVEPTKEEAIDRTRVQVIRLIKKPELNGCKGVIIDENYGDRSLLLLDGISKPVALKRENFVYLYQQSDPNTRAAITLDSAQIQAHVKGRKSLIGQPQTEEQVPEPLKDPQPPSGFDSSRAMRRESASGSLPSSARSASLASERAGPKTNGSAANTAAPSDVSHGVNTSARSDHASSSSRAFRSPSATPGREAPASARTNPFMAPKMTTTPRRYSSKHELVVNPRAMPRSIFKLTHWSEEAARRKVTPKS